MNRRPPLCRNISRIACLLAGLLTTLPAPADDTTRIARLQQQEPANYAFAAYMGSGLYSASDRSLFVLNVPGAWNIPEHPDLRFRLAFSAGFFNYDAEEILDLNVPDEIGTLTLIPGIEKIIPLSERLDLIPHLDFGYARNMATDEEALVYSTGLRTEFHFNGLTSKNVWVNKLLYAESRTFASDQRDSYVQLLTGFDYSLGRGLSVRAHNVRPTLYALTSWSHNGIDYLDRWQDGVGSDLVYETGTTLWAPKPYRIGLGLEADRIGVGYQYNPYGHLIRLFMGSVF